MKSDKILKNAMILFVIAVVLSALLGIVNEITKDRIAEQKMCIRDSLGYDYISATNKEEFHQAIGRFVKPEIGDKSMIFEVFTDSVDETEALRILFSLSLIHI